MVLYAALLVCAVLAAGLVYRYDLYDREPWLALAATALAGALLMRLAEVLERQVMLRHTGDLVAAATAALVEELLRLGLVVGLALLFRRTFDDPMDGLVYGSIAGLGMGAEESVALVSLLGPTPELLPVEVVRLLGHLVMGGITGFGVGMARMGAPRWRRWLGGTVGASLLLHFAWDVLALSAGRSGLGTLQGLLGAALMLAGMFLYGALVVVGSAASREVFEPLGSRSLWGWPFTLLRPDAGRRARSRSGP
jgi:RsiW-degrading membrane proteinase PrsW (M82 family)